MFSLCRPAPREWPDKHADEARRRQLLIYFTLAIVFWGPPFAAVFYFALGLPHVAVAVTTATGLGLLTLWILRRTGSTYWAGNYLMTVLFFVVVYCVHFTGGLTSPVLAWLAVVPTAITLLAGPRAGNAWTFVIICALIALYCYDLLVGFPVVLDPLDSKWKLLAATAMVALTALVLSLSQLYESYMRAMTGELGYHAAHDSLTGAVNRRQFQEVLQGQWDHAERHHLSLSCVVVDIDFFKWINDTCGHAIGDVVLQKVGTLLRSNCRAGDSVCRYGGEEFCVLLPMTDEREAAAWAERTRKAIGELAFPEAGRPLRLTASFGVADRESGVAAPWQMVDLADRAMFAAKEAGRDAVVSSGMLYHSESAARESIGELPLAELAAKDVMIPLLATLREDDTVKRASEYFLALRHSLLPVIDKDGFIAGVVTERDLIADMNRGVAWDRPIREVMSAEVVHYDEEAPARQIYEFLVRTSIRSVVILGHGRPTGLVSRGSLLRWLRNWSIVQEQSSTQTHERIMAGRHAMRAGIVHTAAVLALRSAELPRQLSEIDEQDSPADDLTPLVVGEASRMQEMIDDLLGRCQAEV